jgi:hypothetical protein
VSEAVSLWARYRARAHSPVGVVAATALLLGLMSCSSEPVSPHSDELPASTSDATPASSAEKGREALPQCNDPAIRCFEVSPDRWVIIYLSKASIRGEESAGVVVWNPGGPGLSPPTSEIRRRGLPHAFDAYDIAYLVEPWVVQPPAATCLRMGENDPSQCRLSDLTWSTTETRAAARKAALALGSPVVGLYGASFGAVANTPLLAPVLRAGGWVVLENPAPPPGTSLARILQARGQAVIRVLAGWGRCDNSETCYESRRARLATWVNGGVGELDGRQIALALVALTTDPSANSDFITGLMAELDAGNAPSEARQRALRRANDDFSLRGADGSVQAALVGLWAGTCAAYGNVEKPAGGVAGALASIYRGCGSQRPAERPGSSSSTRVLLVRGAEDAIVPPRIQRLWMSVFPGATSVTVAGEGHFRDSSRVGRAIGRWLAEHKLG